MLMAEAKSETDWDKLSQVLFLLFNNGLRKETLPLEKFNPYRKDVEDITIKTDITILKNWGR
jgi:hypothetical protein